MQTLVTAGRSLGVPRQELINDDASKVQVLVFMGVLRGRHGQDIVKNDAEKTYAEFLPIFDKAPYLPGHQQQTGC